MKFVTGALIFGTVKREKREELFMTLTIEVSGELEAALKQQALAQGLTADRVARRLLANVLTPSAGREEGGPPVPQNLSGEEKARAFVAWAKGHRDTPPLSDEAVSRASMYPDRR